MKTAKDPRHIKRIKLMQDLYAWEFYKAKLPEMIEAQAVCQQVEAIDQIISEAAPAWPIPKINKIDLSILRLAVFELLFADKAPASRLKLGLEKTPGIYDIMEQSTPPKVVVDEAVEIAKEYGSDSSPAFVNGVLGKIIENHQISLG